MLENLIGQSSQVLPNGLPFHWLIILPVILILISRKFFNLPFFVLVLILVLPSLVHSNHGSVSFGLMLSSLMIFGTSFSYSGIKKINFLLPRNFVLFFITLILIIFLHSFFVFWLNSDSLHFNRLIISYVGLLSLIATAYIFVYQFIKLGNDDAAKILEWIWYFIIFLTILVLIRYAIFSPFYRHTLTTLAIFSEPSHFVLACLPFFLFKFIVSSSTTRLLLLTTLVSLAFILRSSTAMIGAILMFLFLDSSVITKKSKFNYFLLTVLLLYVYITYIYPQLSELNPIRYISDRAFDFFKPISIKTNMSSLAVFMDWHEAIMNFLNTKGMGIGFQQLGIYGFQSYMADLIYLQTEMDPNGAVPWKIRFESFVLAPKLISEFGILGVLAICYYLKYFIVSIKYLSNTLNNNILDSANFDILFHSFYVLYFISLFFRGVGYFSVSTFFFLSSVIYLFFLKKNK